MKIFIESCWRCMISRFMDKRGFGTYEMLTVFVVLLIVIVLLLASVFKTNYSEKYDVLEYNAKMFALTAGNLYNEDGTKDVYYLQEIIDRKLSSEIKNPFQGEKYCNSYTSKVEIKDTKKYVTLECGNYLVYQQNSLKTPYTVYQVGKWSTKKSSDDDQSTEFYNYKQDGKDMFDDDLEKDIFLYEFNKLSGTDYSDVSEIPNQENLSKETRYRFMKKVSE